MGEVRIVCVLQSKSSNLCTDFYQISHNENHGHFAVCHLCSPVKCVTEIFTFQSDISLFQLTLDTHTWFGYSFSLPYSLENYNICYIIFLQVSTFMKREIDGFTRVQRVTAATAIVFLVMVSNAMW